MSLSPSRLGPSRRWARLTSSPFQIYSQTRKAIINGVVFCALDQTSDVGEDPPYDARTTAICLAPLFLLNAEFELSNDFFLAAYLRFIALVSRQDKGPYCPVSARCI